ncbi:MAG: putative 4-mercaptohistidine N1-methyltransferase [Verrucomicrobiae bacterium]|nr:putative 4-mercaptohistidine N1-methyltransferase [Verrucomicrobiae bacterium]
MNYEADRILNTYLLFHYGTREEILAGSSLEGIGAASFSDACFRFPVATVTDTFDLEKGPFSRALDLGCAVGRSSFELSKVAGEVIGIDFSQSFIEAAARLGMDQTLRYRRYSESHLGDDLFASVPADSIPERIRFQVGDAMNLPSDLGSFDLVHAANLLCRLSEPLRLLKRLPDLVKPGGQLVLATPATWLEEFTPTEYQPEGLTLDYLETQLSSDFDRQTVTELPFLIRDHQRKFQISTSQASLWIRR